jgi:hypothetical protein
MENELEVQVIPPVYQTPVELPRFELPDVGLDAIQDGVVADRTRQCYTSENFVFLHYLRANKPSALTQDGLLLLYEIEQSVPGGSTRAMLTRNRAVFEEALRNAGDVPLIVEDEITPRLYMEYIAGLRNNRSRGYLSASAYGVKRSALFHLYRAHNGRGFSDQFRMQLANLFRGFFRVLVQRRRQSSDTRRANPTIEGPSYVPDSKFFIINFLFFTDYSYL